MNKTIEQNNKSQLRETPRTWWSSMRLYKARPVRRGRLQSCESFLGRITSDATIEVLREWIFERGPGFRTHVTFVSEDHIATYLESANVQHMSWSLGKRRCALLRRCD